MSDRTGEYAILSLDSYTDRHAGQEVSRGGRRYLIEDAATDPIMGFHATVYRDAQNGRTIIAYRGTDDALDGVVDLGMAKSRLNLQQFESEIFTRNVLDRAKAFSSASGNPMNVIGYAASSLSSGAISGARALDMVPEPSATAAWGSRTGSAELDRLLNPSKLTDANHPGNALFEQILRGVYVLDAKTDRLPDQMSVNLAGSLTAEARREGLTRIDHVVLSDDASRTYAIQGELNSPFKRLAEVPTEIGLATSIETSSAQWKMVGSQDVSHQMDSRQIAQQASHVESPQMQAPIHAAPSMSR